MTSPMPQPQPQAGAPPQEPQEPQGGASLVGGEQKKDAGVQQRMNAVMEQFRNLDADVQSIAQQFPEFAPHAKKIKDEMKSGMMKVVSGLQKSTEVASPRIAG